MTNRGLRRATLILAIILVIRFSSQAQLRDIQVGEKHSSGIGKVHLKAEGLSQLISSLASKYDVPIGLEIALNDNELADSRFEFKGGTLSELFSELVAQHPEYDWEFKDGVFNLIPKDNYRDPILAEMLRTRISHFIVRENASTWNLENSLADSSEIRRIAEAND